MVISHNPGGAVIKNFQQINNGNRGSVSGSSRIYYYSIANHKTSNSLGLLLISMATTSNSKSTSTLSNMTTKLSAWDKHFKQSVKKG
jgi:hypothetical protein